MADISPARENELVPLELSEVSPTTVSPNTLLKGLITIKWPYASSAQNLTFLLADEDIRKRASGGQVKVTLLGEAAAMLDQIESGEEISIAPSNADSMVVEAITEPRMKWHITFPSGCILRLKGQPPRLYGPPAPTKPIIATPLPRVPTPPLPEEPSSQHGVWKTPLKRKFAELTDHSITSSLTDEEEWFGSEPKSGSQDTSRRFSGRMRFVGLDSPNMSSSPQIKRLSNENSFSRNQQRPSEPRKTEISPAVVLQAQNLVSAEILSEKLLHPPRTVGTGMDDLSHVAIQEGSLRPMSAGVGSNAGKRSIGERSFDVFMDEDKDLGAMENSVMEDVLPAELTRPSQAELWSVPAPSLPASERESPEVHEEKSEESEESESEEEDQLNDVTRPDRPSLQLTDTPQVVSAASSPQGSERSDEDLDAYDASGQLIPPNRRRYYQPDQQPSSEEEYSGSDDIDYEHPERFQDDEELSGQDYDEEDTLKHAGYYSQGRRVENEDEFYHSDEEDYSDEEEYESEEEKPVRGTVPVVVDLTLDSSDEEQSEEEEEDDKLELRGHTDEESESEDESEVSEEDEEEIEEEVEEEAEGEDDDADEPEWTGIKSQTPATPFTDISHPSQEQIPQTHGLDVFLDPSLMASHPNIIESTQSHPFTFDPDLQLQSEAIALQHAPNFPPDLIAQALDPAMFQQPPQLDLTPLPSMDSHTASIMDTVLSFAQEHAAIDTHYAMDIPRIDAVPMMQDIQHQEKSFSEMMEEADAILHKHVDNVDSTAQQEFLMGILPMGNQERGEEATVEMQRGLTQDFLPNIVPDVVADGENEAKGDEAGDRKVRQESMVLESVEVRDKSTESMQGAEVPQSVIPVEQPIAPLQEPQTIVQEQIIRVSETTTESTDIHGTTVVEQLLQEESTIITQHPRPPPAQEQQTTHEQQEEQPTSPAPPRSPSLEPLPEDWRTEGLTTPLAYFPPLADIVPPGLRAQKENRMVDVIGVIRTCGELSKTKGVDYVLPLHIVDPSTGTVSGLSVLLFRPHKSALPENPERGSVIVLTDMKVQSFQHRAQVRTTESSGWILFPVNGEVEDSGPPVEYGKEEELMVKQLQHWWKRSLEKGKGKETNGVDGHVTVNGSANGRGVKNKAKRGGKKVNINRG